jgi:phosphatidylserine/phosphatidylglycerophosphate/cardiolipin synthase-like enzyme
MFESWKLKTVLAALFLSLVFGCAGSEEELSPDGELEDGVSAGKADGSEFSDCELALVLDWVNDPATTAEVMQGAGVHTRAARNIAEYRDEIDENHLFDDIEELDDVYYVGPAAFRQLVAVVEGECAGRGDQAEVIFSPQVYEESHLAAVAEAIDGASLSLDIAMYSFRDARIQSAIERAIDRGVAVRMLFETANGDRRDPEGSSSARLEALGVDVRYINKIMHHKFVIIDGAQSSIEQARTGTLITGSANWSSSAGTRYDENTVIIRGNVEALLRFQREFNHLWTHSRDFLWNQDLEYFETMEVQEAAILDDPSIDALFTSANFRVYESSRYGWTFSVNDDANTVSDRLVDLIWSAETSIHLASGHLRSRPVAEALIARHEADPDLDIRVYLDNQEYLSESTHESQQRELALCLEEAGEDIGDQQDCLDRGFLFSYELHAAGIPLRFKYYCYRWHYSYAEQMHHKYMIIDGRVLVSGSYNLSDNAEHNTMENIVIYDAQAFPELVAAFEENFEQLWITGEEEGLYDELLQEIVDGTGASFPIVFEPMAIDWDQVTTLKGAIRDNCPDINSTDFRTNPQRHWSCDRE